MTLSVPGVLRPAFLTSLAAALLAPASVQAGDEMQTRWVTVLAAAGTFAEAKAEAQKIAKASGLPFTMADRVFDAKKGLIYPENYEDEVFAGEYTPRRANDTGVKGHEAGYITIERSEGYSLEPGSYVVVGGVFESAKTAKDQVKQFAVWAPTAYAKKTKLYMGCLH